MSSPGFSRVRVLYGSEFGSESGPGFAVCSLLNRSGLVYSEFNKRCPSKNVRSGVNYKNARDDGLLLLFTSKLRIISLKQQRGFPKVYSLRFWKDILA